MNWIRVARSIPSDPIIGMIAAQLKIRDAEVVGLVVCVLCALPDHASTGDLSGVPDATIERWALWGGKGGRFAPVFRDHMCDDNGVVGAWEKYNGAPMRKAEAAAERARNWREQKKPNATRTRSQSVRERLPNGSTERDGTRRDGTERNGTEILVTTTTSDSLVDAANPAHRLALVIAANKGITEQWDREQPTPCTPMHPGTLACAEDLAAAGVPLAFAESAIYTTARDKTPADKKPPTSLRWFTQSTIRAWEVERAHRQAATSATPAPLVAGETVKPSDVDLAYHTAVRYAKKGDPEWQQYCRDHGIDWERVA